MSVRFTLVGQKWASALRFSLGSKERYIVGRAEDCDILIPCMTVSRWHAELHLLDSGIELADLGSRNGIFIDEKQVSTATLFPGQRVWFGRAQFLLAHYADDSEIWPDSSTNACSMGLDSKQSARSRLTPAQYRVFELLVLGLSEKEVAARLGISPNTVHHHVGAIYRVFGATSRAEFMVLARSAA